MLTSLPKGSIRSWLSSSSTIGIIDTVIVWPPWQHIKDEKHPHIPRNWLSTAQSSFTDLSMTSSTEVIKCFYRSDSQKDTLSHTRRPVQCTCALWWWWWWAMGGKYEKTRAGCRTRKQIIDSREGKKAREWVVWVSEHVLTCLPQNTILWSPLQSCSSLDF